MATIEIDTETPVRVPDLPTCPHDADPAHDRWECAACKLTHLVEGMARLMDGEDTATLLKALTRAYLSVAAQHAAGVAESGGFVEQRAAADGTLSFMHAVAWLAIRPLGESLSAPPVTVPMPGRLM